MNNGTLNFSGEQIDIRIVEIHERTAEWDDFVENAPNRTAYHRFEWNDIITRSFGHSSHYLAAIHSSGKWLGVLPLIGVRSRLFGNFLVSMPFVNYGGVLSTDKAATAALLDAAEKLRRRIGATHTELRQLEVPLQGFVSRTHKATMVLKLANSKEQQWDAFDSKLRNQIRKAKKSQLTVRVGRMELLDSFYDVFVRNMRDLGTPVYAKTFFKNILRALGERAIIAVVQLEDCVVAAGLATTYGDRMEVPWASSVRDYRSMCPNHLLYWELIQIAIASGKRDFDFGRSTIGEGTYLFKQQWLASPVQLHWQYLSDDPAAIPLLNPSNPKYRFAVSLWKRLPLFLTKIIGPRIVRCIP